MCSDDRKDKRIKSEMLERLKLETAKELNVNLDKSRGERINARDAGRVGGNMVRKMIRDYERMHE
ncbi:MAG: alpha/beta-type small acid-soluble spore protein [Clostridia bacterium]|nr:alpha/beta-type small acid-soluble spore protein [Clostridia bacterium]